MLNSGSLIALPTNIRLMRKSMDWPTLAYYDTAIITTVKSFIVQTPGVVGPGKPFQPSLLFVGKARSLP